jgi:hypothetical protein
MSHPHVPLLECRHAPTFYFCLASNYPMPSKSAKEEPTRRLSKPELKELEKLYEQMLRQFRIFLRDMLGKNSFFL